MPEVDKNAPGWKIKGAYHKAVQVFVTTFSIIPNLQGVRVLYI
jgi:hypothetical protein